MSNLGPDILGAILGYCDLGFGETTSWAVHNLHNWDEFKNLPDPNNKWWKKIVEITEEAVKDAKGGIILYL